MSDVELKVGSDAGDLLKGLKQAKEELIAMREAAEKAKKELADSMQSGVKATQAFEAEIQRLLALQKAQADGIDKLNRKIAEYEAALAKSMNTAEVEKLIKKIEELQSEIEKLKKEMAALTTAENANTAASKKNGDAIKQKTILHRIFATVVDTSTKALTGFGKNLLGLGIGAVIGWLTSLITTFDFFADSTETAEEKTERLKKVMEELNAVMDRSNKNALATVDAIKSETQIRIEQAKQRGATEAEIHKITMAGLKEEREASYVATQEDYKAVKSAMENAELSAEQRAEILEKQRKNESLYNSYFTKLRLEEEKEKTRVYLEARKNALKAAEERKKQLEKEYALMQQLLRLEQELAKARLEYLTDGRIKDLLTEELNTLYRVKDLELQKRKATAAEIILIDKIIEQELINTNARKLKINTKYFEDVSRALDDAQQGLMDVTLKGEAQEIANVNERFDKIKNTIEEARKKLVAAGVSGDSLEMQILGGQSIQLEEARQKEITEVTNKWSLERLEKLEEVATAENEILKMEGVKGKALEEIKERNKLYIIINYGKRKLALLESIGGEENKLQIAQIKKAIQDAEKALSEMGKPKFSLLKFFGLDKLEKAELQAIGGSLDIMKSALSDTASAIIGIQDNAINKSRERINQIEDEIRAQEDAVKKAKDLAAEGYANNLAMEERKLATLKAKKVAEQQIEKEALEKKKEMQRTQLLIDSATQASSLATAIANIIKVYSSLPFGGQVLAAAAIAGSVAAFTYGRIQAFKAINTTTARTGRRVSKGKRHSDGGNKYLSLDGNDPHIFEIEEGEWVTNRESSQKYDPILEAINNDTLDKLNRFQLGRMLKPYGIHLEPEASGRISKKVEAAATGNIVVINSPNNDDANWEKQNNILKGIGTKEKTVEYVPGYRIERDGNRVRKIKVND
jgi:hypothetical protein